MARPTLEKAKQQAADLKAGMSFDQWLKKWGFSKQGAWAKTSRLKKIGLLPPDFTTGKVDKAQVPHLPHKAQMPHLPHKAQMPHLPHKAQMPQKAQVPQMPQPVTMVRWRIPTGLLKQIKIKAAAENKTLQQTTREVLAKGLK